MLAQSGSAPYRPYPLRRTLPLVEAISNDFNEQCVKVLTAQRLMYMDYASFESTMTAAMEVFATWDENIKEFTNVAREGETRDFVLVDLPRC
jgi:dynein heavy chain 1